MDFDSRRLRLVEAEYKRGQCAIKRTHVESTPPATDAGDAEAVGALLAGALKSIGRSGAKVLMCVPRRQAVLKTITLPAGTDRDEMPAMVQYQIGKELPFPLAEAVADFTVETHFDPAGGAGEQDSGVDVLTAAVRLPVLEHYRRVADAAGAKLVRLGLRPHANMHCVDRCVQRQPGELVAMVNLTADEAEIDIFHGDSLAFTRSATVKLPPGDEQGRVSDAPAELKQVVTEVVRSLNSYQTVHRDQRLEAILVAGDTGLEQSLCDRLGDQMDIRAELLDPSTALGVDAPSAGGLVAALGLALSDQADETDPIDFLNPKEPVEKSDPRKTLAAAGVLLALLALAGLAYWGHTHKRTKRQELLRIQRQLDDAEELNERVTELRRRAEAVEDWLDQRPQWLGHLAYITALLPGPEQVYLTELDAETRRGGSTEISFTVRARQAGVIEALWQQLHARPEYQLEPIAPEDHPNDPFGQAGFVKRASFDMTAALAPETPATQLTAPPRPPEDVSAELLNQPQGASQ